MTIWMIWFLVALAVIVAKYYTTTTVARMKVRLSGREGRLSAAKAEGKVIRSGLEIAKRNLVTTQRRIADTKELIERLKPELKALEELEQREMTLAKELIAMTKDNKGR